MFSTPALIAVAVFGLILCMGWLLNSVVDTYGTQLQVRLRQMPTGGKSEAPKHASEPILEVQSLSRIARSVLDRLVPNAESDRRRYQSRLLQAGIYSPTALSVFFGVKLTLMVIPPLVGLIGGWLGMIDIRFGLLWGSFLGGIGMTLPAIWLDRRIRHRHCVLRHSFPDFLDLMIVCLESGLSMQGTIQQVSDELRIAHPILAGELNIIQREIDLGFSVESSLRRFAERSGFEGVRTLSTFIRESQRLGTELADALRQHAEMCRSQRESAAEEVAQKASIKILLPTMLLILPAVFVVLAGPAAIQIQKAFSK
jgi:tight adherence protein C